MLMHVKFLHEGATLYKCHKCTKTFMTETDLRIHVEVHKGIKSE